MGTRFGLTVAAILLAAPLLAQGPGGGMGGAGFGMHQPPMERAFGQTGEMGRWWNNPRMVAELKLTDDQRKAMDAILLEHREKLVDLHASLEKAELEMQPLMSDDQPNEAAILAQIDKVAAARAELEKANARFLLAIRAKLTPEQWKQVQTQRNDRGGQMRRDWGQGGEGQHGMRPDGQGGEGQRRIRPDGQGGPRPHWQPGGPNAPQGQPQAPQGPPPGGSGPGSGLEQ
jgi:Spy/CpxP family protein refolding chaperone